MLKHESANYNHNNPLSATATFAITRGSQKRAGAPTDLCPPSKRKNPR